MVLQLYDKDGKPCVSYLLTEEGERAYKAGEQIDFYKGHICVVFDTRLIELMDFR